jgi:hypothetical protein
MAEFIRVPLSRCSALAVPADLIGNLHNQAPCQHFAQQIGGKIWLSSGDFIGLAGEDAFGRADFAQKQVIKFRQTS